MTRLRIARALQGALTRRGFADAAPSTIAAPGLTEEFKAAWKKVAPSLDLPKLPSSFLKPRPAVPATIPTKLTLNLVLPYSIEAEAKEVSDPNSALSKHFLTLPWFCEY